MRFCLEILRHLLVDHEAKSLCYLLYQYGYPAMVKMDFCCCMATSLGVMVRIMMKEQPWHRPSPVSARADRKAPAEGAEVQSIGCAPILAHTSSVFSAESSLQHSAGTKAK